MIGFVVDSSAAVEYLLRTSLGLLIAATLEEAELAAPDLIDAEVSAVLRRAVLTQRLTQERALTAIDDLVEWPLERIPSRRLVRTAWQYRHNLSAYDALYVAAARDTAAPLLTTDGRLARSPGLEIVVQHFHKT